MAGRIEALLLLADEPMTETSWPRRWRSPSAGRAETLAELVAFYDETGRGFELRELGGGWRYYTREEHADLITRVRRWRVSRPSCRRRRWRPWRWSPTSSRSRGPGSRRSAVSTWTA